MIYVVRHSYPGFSPIWYCGPSGLKQNPTPMRTQIVENFLEFVNAFYRIVQIFFLDSRNVVSIFFFSLNYNFFPPLPLGSSVPVKPKLFN